MPLSGRFLLDTNIVIALLQGEAAVVSHLEHAQEVFIPAVVLGELFFGAAKSGRPSENGNSGELRYRTGHNCLRSRCCSRLRTAEAMVKGEGSATS
jgi:hypothetical protein